jgi:hypothetical protein
MEILKTITTNIGSDSLFQLNSMGLILDIIGVAMVWRFDILRMSKRENEGKGALLLEQEDEKAKSRGFWYRVFSHSGLFLIVLGFILQLAHVLVS